jgi:hypothetical protein
MTFDKTYIFSQYNNKDNFGRAQVANIGAGFNPLTYEVNAEQNLSLLPTNKSYWILGVNDINYYDVKTPTATFIYHNAMKNGAALRSSYTQNIGKDLIFLWNTADYVLRECTEIHWHPITILCLQDIMSQKAEIMNCLHTIFIRM